MRVHLPTARGRLPIHVGIGVELREELVDSQQSQGEHQRLVAVVARAEVPLAEGAGQSDLGHFLAVAEDAELCLSGQDLLAPQQARLPTLIGDAVIANDALASEVERDALLRRHGVLRRHRLKVRAEAVRRN